MNIRTVWKAKFDAMRKLKVPKEPKDEKKQQAWLDKRAVIWKQLDSFYSELRELLGGTPVIGDHFFVEIDEKTWVWLSIHDDIGGVIENVILGKCKDCPEMWRIAMDSRPEATDEEINTLFLDNRAMLMWSKEHCMVRTGEYRKL